MLRALGPALGLLALLLAGSGLLLAGCGGQCYDEECCKAFESDVHRVVFTE